MTSSGPRLSRHVVPVARGETVMFAGAVNPVVFAGRDAPFMARLAALLDGTRTPEALARLLGAEPSVVDKALAALDSRGLLHRAPTAVGLGGAASVEIRSLLDREWFCVVEPGAAAANVIVLTGSPLPDHPPPDDVCWLRIRLEPTWLEVGPRFGPTASCPRCWEAGLGQREASPEPPPAAQGTDPVVVSLLEARAALLVMSEAWGLLRLDPFEVKSIGVGGSETRTPEVPPCPHKPLPRRQEDAVRKTNK